MASTSEISVRMAAIVVTVTAIARNRRSGLDQRLPWLHAVADEVAVFREEESS